MTKIVSIIVPTYNAGQFIGSALKSILKQKYIDECQVLVIDDGSTDDTRGIVSGFSKDFPQVTCLSNLHKKGPSGARNTGILMAEGKYIAFLDADDIWLDNHLKEGIDFLENYVDIDVVFFNFKLVDFTTKKYLNDWFSECKFEGELEVRNLKDNFKLICGDLFDILLDKSCLHLQSMIVRRSAMNGILFDEDIRISEDRDFAIKLFYDSKAKFAFKNIQTVVYYRHENSLTSNSIENSIVTNLDHIKLFSGYLKSYQLDPGKINKLENLLYERYLAGSYCFRLLNNHRKALELLGASCKYRISVSQVTELIKIFISMLLWNIFPRKGKNNHY